MLPQQVTANQCFLFFCDITTQHNQNVVTTKYSTLLYSLSLRPGSLSTTKPLSLAVGFWTPTGPREAARGKAAKAGQANYKSPSVAGSVYLLACLLGVSVPQAFAKCPKLFPAFSGVIANSSPTIFLRSILNVGRPDASEQRN